MPIVADGRPVDIAEILWSEGQQHEPRNHRTERMEPGKPPPESACRLPAATRLMM